MPADPNEPPVLPEPRAESWPRPLRIDCDLFGRIVEAGVFGDRPRVWLFNGQIVEWVGRTPKGRRHTYALNVLGARLREVTPPGWFVEQGEPLDIGSDSQFEVDLKVVRGVIDDYRERYPRVADTPLLVEISDAELEFDRGVRLAAYAGAVVPLYWLVNVRDRVVEVYTKPTGPVESPRFESRRVFAPGEEIPVVLDGRDVGHIPVASFFL